MEELNKKLKQLNDEYKEHKKQNELKNNFDNIENVNYKKILEQNIKSIEETSNKLNSFLTDSTIFEQPNTFYNNKKDENICFSNDKEIEDMNNNNNNKMSSLLFTNYKNEMKNETFFNSQTGYVDGNMVLPINTQESYTKNKKYNNKTINNSRMNSYQPIGRNMNMIFDNKLDINKSKVYKDVANKRLNELNKMASVNPYPINYEKRISTMTKDYFNYDSQTEKELNTYYKKNNTK